MADLDPTPRDDVTVSSINEWLQIIRSMKRDLHVAPDNADRVRDALAEVSGGGLIKVIESPHMPPDTAIVVDRNKLAAELAKRPVIFRAEWKP